MVYRRRDGSSPSPVIIGTGLVALDVVIADKATADPVLCAGGTCANVLAALAFLGWNSYPIARLRSDAASKCVIEDLRHWGVKLDYVSLTDSGSTPVIVHHIRQNGNGERSHRFSRRCPACGAWLPWYKAVKAASVPDLSARLPKAEVFFFDRTSRGAIQLAQNARDAGAIVIFEPSAESDPGLLVDALAVAHVVKVASDRLRGNENVLSAEAPLLVIKTLGPQGLQFALRTRGVRRAWKTLPAFRVDNFRDSGGAGDWCTAGLISSLGTLGPQGLAKVTGGELEAALRRGQAMASWACRYDGARGGMYSCTRASFDRAIRRILKGGTCSATRRSVLRGNPDPVWCVCRLASG